MSIFITIGQCGQQTYLKKIAGGEEKEKEPNFFISFKRYCCSELKFEKLFHLCLFFVKFWGIKNCEFGNFGQLTRDIFSAINA